MIKRLLSIVMALCMIFVVTPINVYAQEKVEYSNDGLEEGVMEWTANGSVNGWTTASCSCYLKFELNTKGQSRISYRM